MKKGILILVLITLLSGCTTKKEKEYQEKIAQYESYWRILLNEDRFIENSRFYELSMDIEKTGTEYVYYISLDQPKIAMYDVKVMVIENQEKFNIEDHMLPSAGIFDGPIHLIPNQARDESEFKKGILLVREELLEAQVDLRILVTWKNYALLETYQESLEVTLEYKEEIPELEEETSKLEEETDE